MSGGAARQLRVGRACVAVELILVLTTVIEFLHSILRGLWLCFYSLAIDLLLTLILVAVTTETLPEDLGRKMGIAAGWAAGFYAVALVPLLFLLRTVCRRRFPAWCYAVFAAFVSLVAVAYYFRFLSPLPTGVYSMDMVIFCLPVGVFGWLVGRGFYQAFNCSEEWG